MVVGGGFLGAAVARHASARGARVLVCSRTPRPHAGMWQAYDAANGRLRVPSGARVFVAMAPGPAEGLECWTQHLPRAVASAWRQGARSVTVCGPAGDVGAFGEGVAHGAGRVTVVRVGPLFGNDDACIWPHIRALRERGVARFPKGIPPIPLLWVEDAARAIWRVEEGDHVLRGERVLDAAAMGEAITARFGGRWAWRLWGAKTGLARLRAQSGLPDAWDPVALGARTPFTSWVERLPGLRRKR